MRGRLRSVVFRAALVVCSLFAAGLLLEILLRNFPVLWPQGSYGAPRFSSDLELTVHGAPAVYNRVRWNRRVPNRDGFLDVEHAPQKPSGVTRVGFFGDSYVEALQVPLEDAFFRRLPSEIAGRAIEALAFGISGWGTLHSLMAYRVMGPRYDLDYVVYLFVMNDPGDHYYKVKRGREASAEASDDRTGFIVRMPERAPESAIARIAGFVEQRMLLARIVWLTLQRMMRDDPHDRVQPGEPRAVDQNDYPSTWPPSMLTEAKALTRLILMQFRDEVSRDGRHFSVLYVPRGNQELEGRLPPEDNWLPWLTQTCAELGIPLWNPRDFLGQQLEAGTTIYDDHWSRAGHELVASFVAAQLAEEFRQKSVP